MSSTTMSDTEAAPPDAATAKQKHTPRQSKPVVPHALLDKAISQDPSVIPRLVVRQDVGEVPYVRVGTRTESDNDDKPDFVYMKPVSKRKNKDNTWSHLVMFYWFDNRKSKHVGPISVTWLHEVLSWQLFDTQAAHSRWGNGEVRKRQHSRWLLFVCQHICQQPLPAGKEPTVQKRRNDALPTHKNEDAAPEHEISGRKRDRDEMNDDEEQAVSSSYSSSSEESLLTHPQESDTSEGSIPLAHRFKEIKVSVTTAAVTTSKRYH